LGSVIAGIRFMRGLRAENAAFSNLFHEAVPPRLTRGRRQHT
jgi:hypothetical protein